MSSLPRAMRAVWAPTPMLQRRVAGAVAIRGDERKLGHGAPGVAKADREQFPGALVAEVAGHRQGDHQRQEEREDADFDLLEGEFHHLGEPAYLGAAGDVRALRADDEFEGAAERG